MDKQSLRAELTTARLKRARSETAEQRGHRAEAISRMYLELDQLRHGDPAGVPGIVASYQSLPSEPPTDVLNRGLLDSGIQVIVPVHEVDDQLLEDMHWIDLASGELVAEGGEAFRARRVALIVTPALAIGRDGTRMGKGKGYYDRFFRGLDRYPDGPLRVAIVGPEEVFDSVPVDELDEPIDDWVIG